MLKADTELKEIARMMSIVLNCEVIDYQNNNQTNNYGC